MLWFTLTPTSFRNSRCLADSWIFPISRTSMAADSMEIDDSLYRQVCFAGTLSPAVAFLSEAIKPTLRINTTSHLSRESSSFIPHYLWSCLSLSTSLPSRQRYVLGDNAMHQMAQSSVFLSGMGGLGIEIGRPQFKMSFYTFAIGDISWHYIHDVLPVLSLTLNFWTSVFTAKNIVLAGVKVCKPSIMLADCKGPL